MATVIPYQHISIRMKIKRLESKEEDLEMKCYCRE